MIRASLSLWTLALLLLPSAFAQPTPYDELYDERGEPRPQYAEVLRIQNHDISETRKQKFLTDSRKDLGMDNSILPIPRIFTTSEMALLRKGVEQRAMALRAFVQNLQRTHSGIDQKLPVPKEVIDRILLRSGEYFLIGDLAHIPAGFLYGPDIIRGPDGKFYVLEDNTGFVGLAGDLIAAQKSLLGHLPEYMAAIRQNNNDPVDFFRKLSYLADQKKSKPNSRKVFLSSLPHGDAEDLRLIELYSILGFDVVTNQTKKQLSFTRDGVFLDIPVAGGGSIREPVHYIVINGEHKYLDPSSDALRTQIILQAFQQALWSKETPADTRRYLQNLAQRQPNPSTWDFFELYKVLKSQTSVPDLQLLSQQNDTFPGLMNAFMKDQIVFNYTPGTEFLGDKEFYRFVPDLIRHYLGEEPILSNLPTEVLSNANNELRSDLLEKFLRHPELWVIKTVDGRGGDGVGVGPYLSKEQINAWIERVRQNPSEFLLQKFIPLSKMGPYIVDLRLHALVSGTDIIVSDTPASRATLADKKNSDGKVNLSLKGAELAVFSLPEPQPCEKLLKKK